MAHLQIAMETGMAIETDAQWDQWKKERMNGNGTMNGKEKG